VCASFLTNISCIAYCVLLKEVPRDSSVSHNKEQDVLAPILIYQDLPVQRFEDVVSTIMDLLFSFFWEMNPVLYVLVSTTGSYITGVLS